MKTIVINISPVGDVEVDAKCFVGKECSAATEQIEIVLGGGVAGKKKPKPEFYQSPNLAHGVKQVF